MLYTKSRVSRRLVLSVLISTITSPNVNNLEQCSIPIITGNHRKLVAFQMFPVSIEIVYWAKIV